MRLIPLAGLTVAVMALLGGGLPAGAQEGISAEHGKAIFDAAGCYACHTEKGGAPMAGGPPLATPFGTFYAPNITPDPDTGIGKWTDEDFIRALSEGKSPSGEPFYPVFPFTAYTKMNRQDMLDLKAYLGTLAPVKRPSRAHDLKFPFSVRATLYPWRWLNFAPGAFKPDPARSAQWNRGAYIVQALTHCGECHTPRNAMGGLEQDLWLSGARMPVGDLVAGNLTPVMNGLKDWSASDIATALQTGELPEGGTLGGEMGEVVTNSTSKMSDDDRQAIAAYLKALAPIATTVQKKK
ncbi:MAG: cytochrome c [Pseudolabrys sp.]|jgi:mono/diheme cytochrome c family protein